MMIGAKGVPRGDSVLLPVGSDSFAGETSRSWSGGGGRGMVSRGGEVVTAAA